ncbi:MAG: ATP synthase subunit F [Thermoplasmata archaeon]|nr:ATP synthase subunit F [Thermoplasmata archaeon]
MKIAAISDKDTAVGFRLAGIHRVLISTGQPFPVFQELISHKDIGIVFITEPIANQMGKPLKEYRLKNDLPLIVEIPDKKGHSKEQVDFISHLIKRAVGVDIGKKEK